MASKLQFVSELAGHAARTVTHSVDGWKQYLDTAARIYNYTVEDIFGDKYWVSHHPMGHYRFMGTGTPAY